MYRIANQFNAQARTTMSAAGGGSTSTTCSSCVVTLIALTIGPSALFANLAASAPAIESPPRYAGTELRVGVEKPLSKGTALLLGLAVPALSLLLWFLPLGANVLMIPAGWVAIFAFVYERTRNSAGLGIGIGIAFVIGFAVAAAVEAYMWISLFR